MGMKARPARTARKIAQDIINDLPVKWTAEEIENGVEAILPRMRRILKETSCGR